MRIIALTLAFLLASASAGAVQLETSASVQAKVKQEDGSEKLVTQPAVKVLPGGEVTYTVKAKNDGPKPVGHAFITNPIPEHMSYVEGSATGSVQFSVDGGKTWGRAEALKVKDKATGKSRIALASEYTHIRWAAGSLNPGDSYSESFRARVQ